MLLADGFEEAYIGLVQQFDQFMTCYDYDKCVEILVKRDNMTTEEAIEYMEYNVVGAYVGKDTPCFLNKGTLEELEDFKDDD